MFAKAHRSANNIFSIICLSLGNRDYSDTYEEVQVNDEIQLICHKIHFLRNGIVSGIRGLAIRMFNVSSENIVPNVASYFRYIEIQDIDSKFI